MREILAVIALILSGFACGMVSCNLIWVIYSLKRKEAEQNEQE
jgi:hypothetical protein